MTKEPKASDTNNDLIIYRLDEIKGQLADFKQNYVTKIESLALKQEIADLREEIHDIKKRGNLLNWIYPTLSAAFSTVFTLLIIAYLNTRR